MLDLIRRARAAEPLGLLMLDEQQRGDNWVAIDEHGEQWAPCGKLLCGICDEDGARAGNVLTAQDGWRHLLTGALVCSDCTGFTGEEFPLTDEQADTLFTLAGSDPEAAEAFMRETREALYGEAVH